MECNAATGDAVIIQDADCEYDPQQYLQLFEPIERNEADVVYGSRFMGGRPHGVLFFGKWLDPAIKHVQ